MPSQASGCHFSLDRASSCKAEYIYLRRKHKTMKGSKSIFKLTRSLTQSPHLVLIGIPDRFPSLSRGLPHLIIRSCQYVDAQKTLSVQAQTLYPKSLCSQAPEIVKNSCCPFPQALSLQRLGICITSLGFCISRLLVIPDSTGNPLYEPNTYKQFLIQRSMSIL